MAARLVWDQEIAGSNPATPTEQKPIHNWIGFFRLKPPPESTLQEKNECYDEYHYDDKVLPDVNEEWIILLHFIF